ncbi:MAG: response regulator [Proteobacteria bacterium]|nr:response regulator [Pseudomonadota bacterium]
MRVMIVEDNVMNRNLLEKILQPYGECQVAENGKEAVETFELAWKESSPFDLILMDIMMPKMNGQQALKEIRNLEAQKGIFGSECVKVIMTTVLGDKGNIMEAFKTQCEAYLIKPIDGRILLNEMKNLGLIKQN